MLRNNLIPVHAPLQMVPSTQPPGITSEHRAGSSLWHAWVCLKNKNKKPTQM